MIPINKEFNAMYLDFRHAIDNMITDLLIDNLDVVFVKDNDDIAGFLIMDGGYIDSFYIKPEYRRKGIGKAFIRAEFLQSNMTSLRIVKNNDVAVKFWNSIFHLHRDNDNCSFCDDFYWITGLKSDD